MEILLGVKEIIVEHTTLKMDDIATTSTLDELGISSIESLDIIFAIEAKFDIHFEFNLNESEESPFTTVQDLVDATEKAVAGAEA